MKNCHDRKLETDFTVKLFIYFHPILALSKSLLISFYILSVLRVNSIILFIMFSPTILNIVLINVLDGFSLNDFLCKETEAP